MARYSGFDALLEHMLSGEPVSLIEAMLLFGVQAPNNDFFRIKKRGYAVKSRRVPLTKVLVRMNKKMVCEPPDGLPHKEIVVSEYWIEK